MFIDFLYFLSFRV